MGRMAAQRNFIARQIRREFERRANPAKAKVLAGFFKTGEGEYAEGDRFYGVTVPETRIIVKKYWRAMPLSRVAYGLKTGRHEERLCLVLMLVKKFQSADPTTAAGQIERKKIFDFYLGHTEYINNWDLVDSSAHYIVGAYLWGRPKKILEKLARSKNLWERRIAIIATFYDIYQRDCRATFKIADLLLYDQHDLIHKAVGWMLREVGKRCSQEKLEQFLRPRHKTMPRTMLRYAIERLEETKRQQYLFGIRSFVDHT